MAVANNADDYANGRQNIFFTANNQTPDDGNLTGQCVTLDKWFMAEMSGVPAPFAARGNANTMGRTLVAQGHAVEVAWSDRRRGDIICYEYGTYGHTAIQLSGGRVFESNVNWSGVATKLDSTGDRVYASRIGSENEAWRIGKNPHAYRLKTYSEKGDIPMFNEGDRQNMIAYFGADAGAWQGEVGKDWKTAMYDIMEDNKNSLRLLFNDGDRANLNTYLYGKDIGRFGSQVGKSWKNALYGAFEEVGFKTDQLVNEGDIGNLKTIIGNSNIPKSVVGQPWKEFVYHDLKGLIPASGNAAQVLEQVRQLVNKGN